MPDLRQGCATGKPREDTTPADALALFGAMGDLAHKKIFPALYHMVQRDHLDVPVIGVARAGRANEHLKERVRDSIQPMSRHSSREARSKAPRERFSRLATTAKLTRNFCPSL